MNGKLELSDLVLVVAREMVLVGGAMIVLFNVSDLNACSPGFIEGQTDSVCCIFVLLIGRQVHAICAVCGYWVGGVNSDEATAATEIQAGLYVDE